MKFRRLGFTLFEILIAVALLVVLSVVLLRVFVLTADFWTAGDEQARLYADAKTALSILSEDLENAVYDTANVTTNTGNTAPMFLEACEYTTSENLSAFNTISWYESGKYGPWLHFVTRSKWTKDTHPHSHSHKAMSEICKASYLFAPPTKTGNTRNIGLLGGAFSEDGELRRVCLSDFQWNQSTECSQKLEWRGGQNMPEYFPLSSSIISEFGETGFFQRIQGLDQSFSGRSDHIVVDHVAGGEEFGDEFTLEDDVFGTGCLTGREERDLAVQREKDFFGIERKQKDGEIAEVIGNISLAEVACFQGDGRFSQQVFLSFLFGF